MANYGPDDVGFILLGGYNLLSDSTEIRDKVTALTDESHSLGDRWFEHSAVGLKRAEISQRGYFNDANDALHEALNEQQGQSRVFCYGVEGNTLGKRFVGYMGAMQVDYERIASLDKLHRANANYQGNGQVDVGIILHALGAEAGDANGTAVDNAASSAGGGVAYLQVSAFSGLSQAVIKIQHSSDNSNWSDLVTFSTASSAPTSQRSTVSSTVNRYLRYVIDVTGTGSITFMVGFKRNA